MKKSAILAVGILLIAAACNKTTPTTPPPTAPLGSSIQNNNGYGSSNQSLALNGSNTNGSVSNNSGNNYTGPASTGRVLGATYTPTHTPPRASKQTYPPGTLGAAGSGPTVITTVPPQLTLPAPNTRISTIYLQPGQTTTDSTGLLTITATNIYSGQAMLQVSYDSSYSYNNYGNGQNITLNQSQSTTVNGYTLTLISVSGSQAQISITH